MKTKINSLGIEKDPKDTKVIVAMSGGVDSSTVAGLMKKEGYKVTGITLKLYDDTHSLNLLDFFYMIGFQKNLNDQY